MILTMDGCSAHLKQDGLYDVVNQLEEANIKLVLLPTPFGLFKNPKNA
jgi:hypothetical protein